ncbi:hypothetical protein [Chryseobacterium cucumeris]|uniref:hypothetical protein n=1 Tax=Chryseobacterium cucumeris TaxID=1813611 RepID=UPI003D97087E
MEKVENLETSKFEDVYQPAPPGNRNNNQSGNVQSGNQNDDVDPFSSPEDNTLEKRLDELATDEMKDFIKMISLNRRYDK